MKPADVKAIITLASKGNGMSNVLRQQVKPIAIVASSSNELKHENHHLMFDLDKG